MSLPSFERILALGAHGDDIEMGCGGTLAKAKASGSEIYTLIMTKCNDELPPDQQDRRVAEYRKAAGIIGVKEAMVWDFENRNLGKSHIEIMDRLNQLQGELKPDLVMIPWLEDGHQDHQAVARCTVRSFRRNESIIQYDILRYDSYSFTPDIFVDITGFMEAKLKALDCYQTQKQMRKYYDDSVFTALARTRGAQSGYELAEGFKSYKIFW